MFEAFQSSFSRDLLSQPGVSHELTVLQSDGLKEFLGLFGGCSFRGGLYRVVDLADLPEWRARIHLAFPEFDGQIECFGYDWMGRVFALDVSHLEDGRPGVLMLEPGTGEALEVPANLVTFHNVELLEYEDAALASGFYKMWKKNGGAAPDYDSCIGYKVPLFLGGADDLENLEVSDLNVYWHLAGQMLGKVRGMTPGTPANISLG